MRTYICMDGLGGNPLFTFGPLAEALAVRGHRVVPVDIFGIKTHENRVQRIITAYLVEVARGADEIYLVGQSAGGSAVHIAASRLAGQKRLKGIICLSRAMPRLIFFTTRELFKGMRGRLWDLARARTIDTTEDEYRPLIEPTPAENVAAIVRNRIPLPGPESRTLAFTPPKLPRVECPILYIYGNRDQWIRPAAHAQLISKLARSGHDVGHHIVEDAGHLTLMSARQNEVIERIIGWIK